MILLEVVVKLELFSNIIVLDVINQCTKVDENAIILNRIVFRDDMLSCVWSIEFFDICNDLKNKFISNITIHPLKFLKTTLL